MKTIQLNREAVFNGPLILVNAEHALNHAFREPKLMDVGNGTLLEMRVAGVFQRLMDTLDAWQSIVPDSGFRSFEQQEHIYRQSIQDNGLAFTNNYVALPGHSEHETGLAIDLAYCTDEKPYDPIRPEFPYEGICQQFRESAPKYGFVERYQRGKEAVTGIAHEPWHFRYVGVPHADIMCERNLVLEEYHAFLKSEHSRTPLHYVNATWSANISYVPLDVGEIPIIGDLYTLSGDHCNGFILTVWGGNA